MYNIDYSKWDHIEISDDEDDVHPNIDTPSLFRWRHKARMERDAEFSKEREDIEMGYKNHLGRLQNIKDKIESGKKNNEDVSKFLEDLKKIEVEGKVLIKRKNEFDERVKRRPLNIDTICKVGKTKTIINKVENKTEDKDEEIAEKMKHFMDTYETEIKTFGMLHKAEDTEKFLKSHPHLVCNYAADNLVMWCVDLAVEDKIELMKHVSHQCIVLQFILELAKCMTKDPRDCVHPFFTRFKAQEPEYTKEFETELAGFRNRIKDRAEKRIREAMEKYEVEEQEKYVDQDISTM